MKSIETIATLPTGIAEVNRCISNSGLAGRVNIGLSPAAKAVTGIVSSIAKPHVPISSQIASSIQKEKAVTCSPCHAVTHGMYSVNSAKIYIQF